MRKEIQRARSPWRRRRLEAVRFTKLGYGPSEVAKLAGCARSTVRSAILAFNAGGYDALDDGRARNGRGRRMTPEDDAAFVAAVQGPAPDGGLWNGRKVRLWLADRGIAVGDRHGWSTLRRLGFTLQRPQSKHAGGDVAAQAAFRAAFVDVVKSVRAVVPDATFEVWAQDEARMGLKPIERRCWAPRGARPIALQRPKFEWLYLYGFVRPTTGDAEWLLMPTVSVPAFNAALAHFAKTLGASETKRIILVLDNAGWHVGHDVEWPVGIHPFFLPAYSPELQPAEKLWPLVREALANRLIETLDAAEHLITERCKALDSARDLIRGCTTLPWWGAADAVA